MFFTHALPNLGRRDEMIGLLPELHLGQLAIIPAIGHNAMFTGGLAGKIIALSGAGDGGEGGLHKGSLPEFAVSPNVGCGGADVPIAQAYDIQDGCAAQSGHVGELGGSRNHLAVGQRLGAFLQLVNSTQNLGHVHLVNLKALADTAQ